MRIENQNFFLLCTTIGISAFAWYIQNQLLLNCDVSWLAHAAERLLANGNYVDNFFETNPPLILYLSLPPILLKHYIGLAFIPAIRCYVFTLCGISLLLCYSLLKKIIKPEDSHLLNVFFLALVCLFTIMPIGDFGQREHLLIIFIMPYLLLIAARLQGQHFNRYFAILIGVLAAIGFCIKPHFFVAFCLLELYVKAWRKRPEFFTIIITTICYTISIFIYYPEFINIITPYTLRLYYHGSSHSFIEIMGDPHFLYCLFTLPLVLIPRKNYQSLNIVLGIATIGFLAVHLLQHMVLFYHLMPAFTLATLSLVWSIAHTTQTRERLGYCLISFLSLCIFVYDYFYLNYFWTFIIVRPIDFFAYLAITFLLVFYLTFPNRNLLKIFSMIAGMIVISCIFSWLIEVSEWHNYQFSLTLLILFMMAALVAPSKWQHKAHVLLHAYFAILAFAFVYYFIEIRYLGAVQFHDKANKMITFLKQNPKYNSIYFFSTSHAYAFPMVDGTGAHYASRFPFFWMIPGLVKSDWVNDKSQNQIDKNFLISMIVEDFNQFKPDLVFVDVSKEKLNLGKLQYDYLSDFSKNKAFQTAFKTYRYLTTINIEFVFSHPSLTQYAVYARF